MSNYMKSKKSSPSPLGCTEKESKTDSHKQYKYSKLGKCNRMEWRRCSCFNIHRFMDRDIPGNLLINNKIESINQVHYSIMRVLTILTGTLNISTKKVISNSMSFIKFLLEIGVQLQKTFQTIH